MWNKIFPTQTPGNQETPRYEAPRYGPLQHRLPGEKYRAPEPLDFSSSSIRPGSPSTNPKFSRPGTAVFNASNSATPLRKYVALGKLYEKSDVDPASMTGFQRLEHSLSRCVDRFGPSLALTQKWDSLAEWVDKYFDHDDLTKMKDVSQALWRHVVKETQNRDQPNNLRTAMSFMLYEQLLHVVCLTHPELRQPAMFLRNEILQCIYISPPSSDELERGFFVLEDPCDAAGQAELINRFYGRTYFQSVRELNRSSGASRLSSENRERTKTKFMGVVNVLTTTWQKRTSRLVIGFMAKYAEQSREHKACEKKLERALTDLADREREMRTAKTLTDKTIAALNKELQEARSVSQDKDRVIQIENENAQLKKELEALRKDEEERTAPLKDYIQQLEGKCAEFQEQLDNVHVKLLEFGELKHKLLEMTEFLTHSRNSLAKAEAESAVLLNLCKDTYERFATLAEVPKPGHAQRCISEKDLVPWLNHTVRDLHHGRYAVTLDLGGGARLLDPYLCVVHTFNLGISEEDLSAYLRTRDSTKKAEVILNALNLSSSLAPNLVAVNEKFHSAFLALLYSRQCEINRTKHQPSSTKFLTSEGLLQRYPNGIQNTVDWLHASRELTETVLLNVTMAGM